ncbi:hypothetical protein VA7868_03567 [Vibrio aerogenes CECT 7868]|uniref:TIGR02270 family protein n=1 Tax=Vibrio aerogenes CECT 7868 TaxID=1216006 RepID=A0A1M6AFT4_9VIBR|nr:hypothetical protein [Vibrio aerogenes]SHI35325.1 hypothetical protein VA7868_03567 [Vibrio aerogenes CECT 7868]
MAIFSEQVLTQLHEDAPFWWYLKDQATRSPLYRRKQITELDNRVNAFLTMLALADKNGHQPLAHIPLDEQGGLFVHTWLGIRQHQPEIWQAAIENVTDAALSDELASALACYETQSIGDVLSHLGFSDNPWLRRATLKYAQLRQVRLADAYLQEKISAADEPEVLMALENIACQSHETQYDLSAIQIDSEAIAFAKLYIRYCHGENESTLIPDLMQILRPDSAHLRDLLPLLFSIAPVDQVSTWVQQLLKAAISDRLKIFSIGIAGLTENIPVLIAYMHSPEWAPLAAEALTMIFGVELDDDNLSLLQVEFEDKEKQSAYEALAEETWHQRYQRDKQAQPYEPDLPYPDIEKVTAWWAQHQAQWESGQRYFAGQQPDQAGLEHVLANGNQQQRILAALYLKRLDPEKPMHRVV